jgi:hypothetical protein
MRHPSALSILSCLSLLIATPCIYAEGTHVFTSPDGRKLEAEIVSASPDRVSLKTSAGAQIVAMIDKFSPADQEFIAQWRKDHPVTIKYKFAADYAKSKVSSTKRKERNTEITTEMWECNMKITNESGQTLEGVTADYVIFYDQMDKGNKISQSKTGKAELGVMKAQQQLVVKTESVALLTTLLDGGFYYDDGTKTRQKDSISGMIININHDGKKVFSWSSSGVPKGAGAIAEGTKGSLLEKK